MTTDLLRSRGYDPRGPGADRRYGNVPDTATRDAVADALEDARQAWRDWQDCETRPGGRAPPGRRSKGQREARTMAKASRRDRGC